MDISLINPPEKLRVWAGIPKAHAHGVLFLRHVHSSSDRKDPIFAE